MTSFETEKYGRHPYKCKEAPSTCDLGLELNYLHYRRVKHIFYKINTPNGAPECAT